MAASLHACPGSVSKALLLFCVGCATSFAYRANTPALKLNSGKEIYEAACVACHGSDGKGMPKSTLGFEPPRTFPDFTRCDQTTPEMDSDWKAIIREGGEFRGFSQIMPSFRDALTSEQMDKVIHYLRGFCHDSSWPRGELNLPRPLATDKAYPENESIVTTTLNAQRAPGVSVEIVHEQRFGVKNHIEVSVPVDFLNQNQVWYGGVGDVALGLKRELFSNLRSGSILSLQGEAIFPIGNVTHGLGSGSTTFGVFAAFGQLLPARSFVQFQLGSDLPIDTAKSPRTFYWRTALGKSFNQGHGFGRMWSPMIEMLSDRDLEMGAKTNYDVLPEMQVTLSRRQHIRANAGVRIPVNNTAERSLQVMFYLLWDWQDGRLTEGW